MYVYNEQIHLETLKPELEQRSKLSLYWYLTIGPRSNYIATCPSGLKGFVRDKVLPTCHETSARVAAPNANTITQAWVQTPFSGSPICKFANGWLLQIAKKMCKRLLEGVPWKYAHGWLLERRKMLGFLIQAEVRLQFMQDLLEPCLQISCACDWSQIMAEETSVFQVKFHQTAHIFYTSLVVHASCFSLERIFAANLCSFFRSWLHTNFHASAAAQSDWNRAMPVVC